MSDREVANGSDSVMGWDRDAVAETLRSSGYDVDPARPGDPPGGSISARRDLGDRVILFSVDGGGRFRIEITWLVGEWPSRQELAGIPLRIVDSVTRAVNVSGHVERAEQLAGLIAGLGEIVSWAGVDDGNDEAAEEPPEP
jgi:hypothetical protein